MSTALRTIFALVFFVALAAPATVSAQEQAQETKPRRYSRFYNGSFVDLSMRGGKSAAWVSGYDGWSMDIGFRHSFPMHLLDLRLAYRYDELDDTSSSRAVVQQGANLSFAVHPLYMALLFSDWFGYVLASLYGEIGVGMYHASNAQKYDDLAPSWHVGAGLDFPLWDPDTGWALWLNALYRYQRSRLEFEDGDVRMFLHTGFAGLSLRFNGLLF